MAGTVFIDGGAPLGLPAAVSITSADLVVLAQGGTPGVPGTATDRAATLAQIFGGSVLGPFLPLAGGSVTGSTTFGAGSGGVGTGLTVNNGLIARTLASAVSTFTLAGATQQNVLSIASNYTGASTNATPSMVNLSNSRDAIDASGSSQGYHVLNLIANIGDGGGLTGTAGTHGALLASINQDGAINSKGATLFLGTANVWYTGGAAITGGDFGNGFALNPQTILTSGASGYSLAEVVEGTVQSDMPVNTLLVRGWLSMFSGGQNQAPSADYGVGLFKNPAAKGFRNGIIFARPNAPWGIDPTGSLISSVVQTNGGGGNGWTNQVAAFGVNLPTVNFGTSAWWTSGFQVVGDGTLRVGAGTVAPAATGLAIDAVNYVGSSPTISNAGASYVANDQIYDTNGGILQVDTVNGSGNILTWHYLRVPYAYGGAGPATMALRGGSGNQAAVVGVTWTQETQLSLQASGGLTSVGGSLTTPNGYQQNGSLIVSVMGTTNQSTRVGINAGALLPSNDTETTAIGWNALAACTGATLENTAVGWGSLRTLTTGFFNTAVGVNTGGLIVTDTDNALFGTDVMRDSTGGHNVAVGNGALRDGVHNQNVAIGHLAMTANGAVTANTANNVAVGYQTMSGAGITTASNNVMVGYTAGQVMTTGTNNTGVGSGALNELTSGVFNATLGRNSLVAVTTGFNNAALGFNAGASITTGASNLVLGPAVASTTLTTGTGNILIGVTAAIDTPAAGTSNTFALGNHATNLMRATAINTATPAFFLDWLPGSTTFANDAAAAVGGVAVGQVYRNGSVVQCRIT